MAWLTLGIAELPRSADMDGKMGGGPLKFRFSHLTTCAVAFLAFLTTLGGIVTGSRAADVLRPEYAAIAPAPSGWQFRVTPYAWAPSVNGSVTVRGHTADVDMSFWDLFDSGSSRAQLDSLAALMGYVEAQKGPWGIYGDVVWGKFDFSGSAVTERNPVAKLKLSARANAGLNYEATMAESGLTYQVARWGAARSTALDVLGGARYWNQELDLSLAVDASAKLGNLGLKRSGSRAVARSGTLEWVDPFVGARLRHELAPGWGELEFLGDVGGFGVGSDFTWQLFGGYSFDFSVMQTTLHGLVGYRALSIDYTQDGPSKNNLDLVLHGPVAGLSFRW